MQVKADAVVTDGEDDLRVHEGHDHFDFCCLGMFADIIECFLKNPEEGCFDFRRKGLVDPDHFKIDRNLRMPIAELLDRPLHGCQQSHPVKDIRAQGAGDFAADIPYLFDEVVDGVEFPIQAPGAFL